MRFTSQDVGGLGAVPPMPGEAVVIPKAPVDLPQAALSKIDRAQGWADDVLSLISKIDSFVGTIAGLSPTPGAEIVDQAPGPSRGVMPQTPPVPPAPGPGPADHPAPEPDPAPAPAPAPTLFDLLQAVVTHRPDASLTDVLNGIQNREPWLQDIARTAGFK